MIKNYFIPVFVLLTSWATAQDGGLLKPEDVIKLTIENNFDVQIAKNNEQVAKNNNNIGLVGGALPPMA